MLSFVEEKYGIHAEAYKEGEVLASKILNKMVEISFENNSVDPFQRSSKYQPDSSPEEGTSRQLSHE